MAQHNRLQSVLAELDDAYEHLEAAGAALRDLRSALAELLETGDKR
ncbi:MAG: hypothetical protein ACODAF_05505 [Actinomycetota bacterium]